MVRYTIPTFILAMSAGAMGSAPALRKGSVVSSDGASAAGHQVVTDSWKDVVKNLEGGLEQNGNANGNANGNGNGNSGRTADDSATRNIQGTYAVALNEGVGEVYAIGVVNYDDSGALSGSLLFNIPADDSAAPPREFFTTPVTGTYSEGEDGMGDQSWTYKETPIGAVGSDVLLQVAEYEGSSATKVNAYSTNVSRFLPGGALVRYQMVARPSAGFSNGSLTGTYFANASSIGPGGSLNILGQLTFGGDGNAEGLITINGTPVGELVGGDVRFLIESGVAGTYSVNDDGTGDLLLTNQALGIIITVQIVIAEVAGGNVKSVIGTFVETSPLTGGPVFIEFTQ